MSIFFSRRNSQYVEPAASFLQTSLQIIALQFHAQAKAKFVALVLPIYVVICVTSIVSN